MINEEGNDHSTPKKNNRVESVAPNKSIEFRGDVITPLRKIGFSDVTMLMLMTGTELAFNSYRIDSEQSTCETTKILRVEKLLPADIS